MDFFTGAMSSVAENTSLRNRLPGVFPKIHRIEYGNVEITNQEVINRFTHALLTESSIRITNENLGGDTAPGCAKTCMIEWTSKGHMRAKHSVREWEWLNFDQEIFGIEYGGRSIDDPGVKGALLSSLHSRSPFRVTNDSLGGDPRPGVPKTCRVTYYSGGSDLKAVETYEGGSLIWA